ncbi:hypothetical protein EDD15DRAFT_2191650 [Pisolithus albus]|nr:hypothetical protein EDD15DRAFT_2191650 [Pisolithus albus]
MGQMPEHYIGPVAGSCVCGESINLISRAGTLPVHGHYAFTRILRAANAWTLSTAVPPPATSKISMVSQIWAEKSSWFVHGRVVDVKLPDTTTTGTSVSSTSSTIGLLVTQTNLSYAGEEGVGSMTVMKFAGTERLPHPSLVQIKDSTQRLVNTGDTATPRDKSAISSTAAMRWRYRFKRELLSSSTSGKTRRNQADANRHRSMTMKEGGAYEGRWLGEKGVDDDSSLGYNRRNDDREGPVVPQKRSGSSNPEKLHIPQCNLNQPVQDIRDRIRKLNVPLLVLGGDGCTIKNVSRCWTYETAALVGAEIPDELSATTYDPFFRDSQWKLHPPLTSRAEHQNIPASLPKNYYQYLQGAPSVAMQEIPPNPEGLLAEEDENRGDRDEERGNQELQVYLQAARKPRTKRTRGRGRGRASGGNGREEGDEPGGASSTKPGKTRGRIRSRAKPRGRVAERDKDVEDMDVDFGVYPACNVHESTSVLLLGELQRDPLGVGFE